MLLEGLPKSKRAIVLGILNGDPRAILKWSQNFGAYRFPAGKMGEAAARVERGAKRLNKRTGEYFHPLTDVEDWRKIEPAISRTLQNSGKSVEALRKLRALPLDDLRVVFGPRFWKCVRCGDFFEADTLRFRRYCSRACGSDQEARKAVYEGRATEKSAKLKRVRAAMEVCPQDCDRKAWIATKARVSKNWITYAVVRGEIEL